MREGLGVGGCGVFILLIGLALGVDDRMEICVFEGLACEGEKKCELMLLETCEKIPGVDDEDMRIEALCSSRGPSFNLHPREDCSGWSIEFLMKNSDCRPLVDADKSLQMTCVEAASKGEEGPDCFSGSSLVNLRGGSVKRVSDVVEGDVVQSFDVRGQPTFSEVFLVQHHHDHRLRNLRQISYRSIHSNATGSITLSDGHLIRKSVQTDSFIAARDVTVGSPVFIILSRSNEASEAYVTDVRTIRNTVRNLHTMNDRIIIDGVMASSYTDVAPYNIQRIAITPLKVVHLMGLTKLVKRIDSNVHHLYRSIYRASVLPTRIST